MAKQMGDITASMGAQFTLSMGDNFYYNGVTDVDDPRFKEMFFFFFFFFLSIKLSALQSSGYTIAKANQVCTQGTKKQKTKDRIHT